MDHRFGDRPVETSPDHKFVPYVVALKKTSSPMFVFTAAAMLVYLAFARLRTVTSNQLSPRVFVRGDDHWLRHLAESSGFRMRRGLLRPVCRTCRFLAETLHALRHHFQ